MGDQLEPLINHVGRQHINFAKRPVDRKREGLKGQENTGIRGEANAGTDDVDFSEMREAREKPTRLEKVPVEELERSNQAAMEIEPTFADERSEEVVRDGKLGEDVEEEGIGEMVVAVHVF